MATSLTDSFADAPQPTPEQWKKIFEGQEMTIGGLTYSPASYDEGGVRQVMRYKDLNPGSFFEYFDSPTEIAQSGQFEKSKGFFGNIFSDIGEAGKELAPIAAIALTAGGAGAALGSALTGGALTGTAASALGNALISGGAGALTGQDPLKAALLAAGGTYAGSLFGGPSAATEATLTDAQFVAADAAQLAAQGLGADQIEQVLRASGVNTVTAVAAAEAATSGMNVDQIAKDITLGNRGLFTDTTATTTPTTITTSPEGLQTVTATASAPTINAGGLLAAVPSAVLPQANIVSTPLAPIDQQIEVTSTKQPTVTQDDLAAAITSTVNPFGPDVGPQLSAPGQVIDVTGTAQPQKNIGDVAAAINAGTLYGPGMTGTQTTVYDKVLEATDSKTAADAAASAAGLLGGLTLADILKVLAGFSSLGMLGGGGTGGGGTTTALTPTTPVPVGNADYYNAVQQYYNTYMPQTPRDVATPLQQWYEGKFGG